MAAPRVRSGAKDRALVRDEEARVEERKDMAFRGWRVLDVEEKEAKEGRKGAA